MSANTLLNLLTQALFVIIFVTVTAQVLRRPLRATVDTALLFGMASFLIAEGWVLDALDLTAGRWLMAISSALIMALPYLLLRLVDDFSDVRRWLMRAAEVGLALAVVGLFAVPPPLPAALTLLYVLYFFGLQVYAAMAFVREAGRSSGVTRRRMHAVAAGSLCLGLVILAAGLAVAVPALDGFWTLVSRLTALGAGLGYFLGFAPPDWLRRAWQEPELRSFLSRAALLPRLPDTATIVRELEASAAAAIGAPGASIGLWDDETRLLRFLHRGTLGATPALRDSGVEGVAITPDGVEVQPGELIAGRAFATQQPVLSGNTSRDDPAHADIYRAANAAAALAAPITAGQKRLGVLSVYAPRAPIFAADDLILVRLLADQAAVILESRALIDEATRLRAREEATRLKDDFLSAAAHDLKTPLTTLVAQAQLLERRAIAHPETAVDINGVRRIVREAVRLRALVLDLIDASRVEHGKLVGTRQPVDLVPLAREVCERHDTPRHPCVLEATGPVVAACDATRIIQLLDNLIENAIKYSPDGGEVRVSVQRAHGEAHLTVSDHGIGIPAADLPHVFERFHRGTNVDDRRFAGMGLGLFICKGIVEQHGGRIRVESATGRGTTFYVALPGVTAADSVPRGVLVS